MTRVFLTIVLSAGIAAPAFAQAPAGPCKPVFDAMLKETTTPHHIVTTRNGTALGESITTADASYVLIKGAWKKSQMSPQAMLAQQQENIRDTTVQSCKALPDEVVDGRPTSVYQAHYEQKDVGVSEAKVWIAKATGLPLRTDVSIQAGEKTSVVSRMDYDNIKAPVVK